MKAAIRAEGLTKAYARYALRRQFATLKSALLRGSLLRDLAPDTVFTALRDVSFEIAAGSTVAVIGPNGSGKSTLLKLLAGVLKPSSGTVSVEGRVAALLELGTGFHPEVSGRENVIINGMMLGLSRREIERKVAEIVRFAELEEFVDAPVKTYSSGMYARLAFSVAFAVEPDVLLVDEILAVGDEAFGHKCLDRFHDFKRRGKTIVFVTHGLMLAENLADVALLFEGGRLTAEGMPREVVDRYRGHVHAREIASLARENTQATASSAEAAPEPAAPATDASDSGKPGRWGNREIEICEVVLRSKDGAPAALFHTGDTMLLEIEYQAEKPQPGFVFAVAFRTRDGRLVYEANSIVDGFAPRLIQGRGRVRLEFPTLNLLEGGYSLDAAVHRPDGMAFDYRRACLMFAVRNTAAETGIVRLEHAWRFDDGVSVEPGPK